MRQDLDRLMKARNLDGILVSGQIHGNPAMYYMANGAGLTQATIVKKIGESPVLIAAPMEREEAKAAGLPIELTTRYNFMGLLKKHKGDMLAAKVEYTQKILEAHHIKGRVGFYGMMEQGSAYAFLKAFQEASPDIEVVGEYDNDLLSEARTTKDKAEAERIRQMGQRTIAVVKDTVAFLQQHKVGADEVLRKANGEILTVGDVHNHIRRLIALQGMEDPEGFIFATGGDGGIPHSKGTPEKPMRLGESIVFDIYPCEAGGGYFFDMTRTFSLGYATEAVQRLYDDVKGCIEHIDAALKVGEEAKLYQQMTCKYFQERGHPTIADTPDTMEGYVHTVSHGLGINVHEMPVFRDTPTNTARLQPGNVFTIEPGLYYPEKGMGCRLEDVIWIDEDGIPHNFTTYPYELVVPMG